MFIFILLIGCSSPEYNAALDAYKQAKAEHQLEPIVIALKTLSKLDPEKYQSKLDIAKVAQFNLKEAKRYLLNNEFHLAYLASHASYRTLFSLESQSILIKSGKLFLPIFLVDRNIEHLFEDNFSSLSQEVENYREHPIQNWNLVALNQLLQQLSKSDKVLKQSLAIINNKQLNSQFQPIAAWQSNIEARHKVVKNTLDYLVNLALYRSSKNLLILNESLAEDSRKLLSIYVNVKAAKYNLQSYFIKAREQHSPYKVLIENISLATQLSRRDVNANWYKEWNELESFILEPKGLFEYYPQLSAGRTKQLNQLIQENKPNPPDLTVTLPINDFKLNNSPIYNLIEKLKMDYLLLI